MSTCDKLIEKLEKIYTKLNKIDDKKDKILSKLEILIGKSEQFLKPEISEFKNINDIKNINDMDVIVKEDPETPCFNCEEKQSEPINVIKHLIENVIKKHNEKQQPQINSTPSVEESNVLVKPPLILTKFNDHYKLTGFTDEIKDFKFIKLNKSHNDTEVNEVGVLDGYKDKKLTLMLSDDVTYKIDPNFNKNNIISTLILSAKNNFNSNYPIELVIMDDRKFKYIENVGYLEIEKPSIYNMCNINNVLGYPVINFYHF